MPFQKTSVSPSSDFQSRVQNAYQKTVSYFKDDKFQLKEGESQNF